MRMTSAKRQLYEWQERRKEQGREVERRQPIKVQTKDNFDAVDRK